MRVAIVQDELVRKGGSEQVSLSFHAAFPEAPIYTLCYNPDTTYPEFRNCTIKTSWLGRYIRKDKHLKRFFFPLGIMAMQQLYLKDYDVVLQSTTHCAKYVKTDPGTLIITYCHTPFRLAWNPASYEEILSGFLKKKVYEGVIKILKQIDRKSAERTDWFLTNASEVVQRIIHAYQPERYITVINPSVKCKNFYVSGPPEDYYLMVSRFEPYKKVDLVIEAFNRMPDKKLVIIGKGSKEKQLKEKAGENIVFLSGLNSEQLAGKYANCRALIFPQLEDYGITPLEANASGRPVIAYGRGGVLDTMIPYTANSLEATAVFFDRQSVASLINAIRTFEKLEFNPSFIRAHAEKFDESIFVRRIRDFVQEKYNEILEMQLKEVAF